MPEAHGAAVIAARQKIGLVQVHRRGIGPGVAGARYGAIKERYAIGVFAQFIGKIGRGPRAGIEVGLAQNVGVTAAGRIPNLHGQYRDIGRPQAAVVWYG